MDRPILPFTPEISQCEYDVPGSLMLRGITINTFLEDFEVVLFR